MAERQIDSIEDLIAALEDEAREWLDLECADLGHQPGPGIDEETAGMLAADFDLGPRYLAVAHQTDLTRLEIGYIFGSPNMDEEAPPLLEQLREARENCEIAELLAEKSLVCVADACGEVIAVGAAHADCADRVFGADCESGEAAELYPLAPDFATYLIAAGRLKYSVPESDEDVIHAPKGLLNGLGLSAEEADSWRRIARMMSIEIPK
jgi:hypothetical protein